MHPKSDVKKHGIRFYPLQEFPALPEATAVANDRYPCDFFQLAGQFKPAVTFVIDNQAAQLLHRDSPSELQRPHGRGRVDLPAKTPWS